MGYAEILKLAIKDRSINSLAKQWGIPQPTLDKYARGDRLPSFKAAKVIAEAAGVSAETMLDSLAVEEEKRKELAELEKASYNASSLKQRGALAQLVEQRTLNP